MTIYANSRYEDADLRSSTDVDNVASTTVYRNILGVSNTFTVMGYYQTKVGDRLDQLAYHFYSREDYLWQLADANPTLTLTDPLPPGLIIVIPNAYNLQ
jgi:phage tail protein X